MLRSTSSRLVSALVGAALLALIVPAAAHACSCASYGSPRDDARAILAGSDGAFIGVLKSVRRTSSEPQPGELTGPDRAVFKYRVRESFDAKLGDFVTLNSTTDDGICGLSSGKGYKVALGIYRHRDGWTSGSCSYMRPKALRAVAGEPSGRSRLGRGGCEK